MVTEMVIGNSVFSLSKKDGGTYVSKFLQFVTEVVITRQKNEVLGTYQSKSDSKVKYYVIRPLAGEIFCTCMGFHAPNKCWHYRDVMSKVGVIK